MAARDGFGAVIACVRPNQKARYPLMAMADYAVPAATLAWPFLLY